MNNSPRFDASVAEADAGTSRDAGGVVDFARRVAAPRLRVRNFQVRARVLSDLAARLLTTERSFDIDRGLEALEAYAAKARRELPDAYTILEAPRETIGPADAGVERRVLTAIPGVAVHLNTSRFACGELLMKFAPAFLAGVPVIAKPAPAAMPLVLRLVNRIASSEILPEGALQVIGGDADDIFAHLGAQDVVAVSGGREAVKRVRASAALAGKGVRVLSDRNRTDVALLGSDALDGSPEFELFVRDLASDILNVDRCTLVPRLACDAVSHALTRTMQELGAHGPLPVLTPYDSIAEALEIGAQHSSDSVATIYTYDDDTANALITGMGPLHDRIIAIDRECSADVTSDRAAQHADLRRVREYMHAVTIRGSANRVAGYTGAWGRGASEITFTEHPFRVAYDDLAIGQTHNTAPRTIALEDIEQFAALSGEVSPHLSGGAAHAMLVLAIGNGLISDPEPGPLLATVGIDKLRFTKPVMPGDAIAARLTVAAKLPGDEGSGEVRWDVELSDQHGETVATYELLTLNGTAATL